MHLKLLEGALAASVAAATSSSSSSACCIHSFSSAASSSDCEASLMYSATFSCGRRSCNPTPLYLNTTATFYRAGEAPKYICTTSAVEFRQVPFDSTGLCKAMRRVEGSRRFLLQKVAPHLQECSALRCFVMREARAEVHIICSLRGLHHVRHSLHEYGMCQLRTS